MNAPNTEVSPREACEVRHFDDEGYECGGPHYRPPSGGDWAWCEPDGAWINPGHHARREAFLRLAREHNQ